jgi:hypothetical protein
MIVFGCTGIEGNSHFTYLEGCFHLLTPYIQGTSTVDFKDVPVKAAHQKTNSSAQLDVWKNTALSMGLSANFPGVTLSTGRMLVHNRYTALETAVDVNNLVLPDLQKQS